MLRISSRRRRRLLWCGVLCLGLAGGIAYFAARAFVVGMERENRVFRLSQISKALWISAQDRAHWPESSAGFIDALNVGLRDPARRRATTRPHGADVFHFAGLTYVYFGGCAKESSPSHSVLVMELKPEEGEYGIVTADGESRFVKEAELYEGWSP